MAGRLDPLRFDAIWYGDHDQLWIILQHLKFDHFLILYVQPYKHYTKKDTFPLVMCVPIITEVTRKALSLALSSSSIVKGTPLQKTLSAFFPSSDDTFVNIHGNPKDTARKQYPAAHPYHRVSVSDHLGLVEPVASKRVELTICSDGPPHFSQNTQRIVDPQDSDKTLFVPTIFDVDDNGKSALYEYLSSRLNKFEDLSERDQDRLATEDNSSLIRAHDVAIELGILPEV